MIARLQDPLRTNSFFLFGARGTGKSTFLRHAFAAERTLWLDLLDPEQENRYALRPGELTDQIRASQGQLDWVVIDEIQKVPKLLDVVHSAIETHGVRFALTGSSARKLKRDSVNSLDLAVIFLKVLYRYREHFAPSLQPFAPPDICLLY